MATGPAAAPTVVASEAKTPPCEERPLDWIRRVRQRGFHAPVVLLGPPQECSPRSDEFEGLGAFSVMMLDPHPAGPPAERETEGHSAQSTHRGSGERVLVLSQRRSLWQFARYVLERSCYEVLCTLSRDTLLEFLTRDGADLLLIDAAIADGAATDTSRRIRADARWATLPLLWSAPVDAAGDVEHQARAAGATHLLREPVAGHDLLDVVTRLVRPTLPPRPA